MKVYKVVRNDPLNDRLVSAIIAGEHQQVYHTDRPTVCKNMFVFAALERAMQFAIGANQIWVAETPGVHAAPEQIIDFMYLDDDSYGLFDKFWRDPDYPRISVDMLDPTPTGTMLCNELTLLERVFDDRRER